MSYEIKGRPTKITATSRCAICIRDKYTGKDNFYTVELSEERALPDSPDVNIQKEYDALFDSVNACVDKRCEEIVETFAHK